MFASQNHIKNQVKHLLTAAAIREIIKEQSKKLGIGIRMLNSATHQYFMKDIK